ncbi:MAG TPA: hypothetical protein VG013_09650 [Gemmataceae bacterium]|jgi:hypothetical protein|nr:hypothetical protein [Gemmataceae bacterium]
MRNLLFSAVFGLTILGPAAGESAAFYYPGCGMPYGCCQSPPNISLVPWCTWTPWCFGNPCANGACALPGGPCVTPPCWCGLPTWAPQFNGVPGYGQPFPGYGSGQLLRRQPVPSAVSSVPGYR